MKRTEKLFQLIRQIRYHAHKAKNLNGKYEPSRSLEAIQTHTTELETLSASLFKEGFDAALLGMSGWIDAVTFPDVLEQSPTTQSSTQEGTIQ